MILLFFKANDCGGLGCSPHPKKFQRNGLQKKYPLLKPKNVALEHRHFVIGNRYSNDPLSIAMFQCNSHFNIWSILPKPQENHIQNTTRQVRSHGLMRWKRPEAEKMPKNLATATSRGNIYVSMLSFWVLGWHLSFPPAFPRFKHSIFISWNNEGLCSFCPLGLGEI